MKKNTNSSSEDLNRLKNELDEMLHEFNNINISKKIDTPHAINKPSNASSLKSLLDIALKEFKQKLEKDSLNKKRK